MPNPGLKNNISVIIPVFSAESFVRKAVESALLQEEVAEVLLIEDGSEDDSLKVCTELAGKYEKVKLLTHPDNVNKGAGLSRNLGIQNATADYIAFLDADDFFLPDRFRAEREILKNNPEADGVYGALGFHYYTSAGEKKFREKGLSELTTLQGKVPPNELFYSILWLHPSINGHFSVDTLTIKRDVFFGKTEMFNNLKLHEDTVFILQLSLNCILEPGILDEAIAVRGVHENNRIVNIPANSRSRFLMWEYLFNWSIRALKDKKIIKLFEAFMVTEKISFSKRGSAFFLLLKYAARNRFFFSKTTFFNSSCFNVFGKYAAPVIIKIKNSLQGRISNRGQTSKNYFGV